MSAASTSRQALYSVALPTTRIVRDTTAPTVTRFTPADGAIGVATNANIVLTFSEAIKRGTGTIVLRNAAGSIIESFSAATSNRLTISGNALTIDPTQILAADTRYTITFAVGTIKDLTNNSYAGTNSYDFRTAAQSSSVPTVVSFSPANGASAAATGANIVVTFSTSIKRGTGTIVMKDQNNVVVESFNAATSSRLTFSGTTLTIDPTRNLNPNVRYTVSIAAGSVRSLGNINYAGTSSYYFRTAASLDRAPPTVTSLSPTDNSSGAATNANIVLTFSEAIQRGSGTIVIRNQSNTIIESFNAAGSGRLTISGNTLTIDPTQNMQANTRYRVIFSAGNIKDLAGNNYAGTSSYDFATAAFADTGAPTAVSFSPADGAAAAAVSSNIVVTFSETIRRGTGTIVIRNQSNTIVESFNVTDSNRLAFNGSTLTIDPTQNLSTDTRYTITISGSTVKDMAGNAYAGTSTYDFTTAPPPDTTAPTVTGFSPSDGATGVAINGNLALTFSEAVQRGTGTIVIRNDADAVIESFDAATSNRLNFSGNILTIDPTASLATSTHFTVSFDAGGVRDLAGNAYAGTSSYDFTTAAPADATAPTVDSFLPADGATGVAVDANLVLTFSEAILRGTGTIVIRNDANAVIESFDAAASNRLNFSGSTLTIDPTASLAADTHYTVTFAAGCVADLVGNPYAGTGSYDFRTAAPADVTAPTVQSYTPADGSNTAAVDTTIALTFSEAIQRGSGTIVIRDGDSNVIESFDAASSNRLNLSGSTLTITPTASLVNNSYYTVTLAAGSVADLAGNPYAGSSSYDFTTAHSAFNIDIQYSGDPSYQIYFDQAAALWEKVVVGDLPIASGIDDLRITAAVAAIDGAGQILAQAGPTMLRGGSNLPFQGNMTFDSADLASMVSNGTLLRVVEHEMGHVLGIGTLWDNFGFNTVSGQYTGSQALARYRTLSGDGAATYVPLETVGGAGTVNVHWRETTFNTELMTGYSESNSNMPLSSLSVAALADLGYQVNYSAAESYSIPPALVASAVAPGAPNDAATAMQLFYTVMPLGNGAENSAAAPLAALAPQNQRPDDLILFAT